MTGIIDVGGGLRGIYGAGVLDRCMDDGVCFDANIGVSAGSANMAAFLARQRGRNYFFYTEYAARPEYMGPRTLAARREYIDLDYVYGTLSNDGGDYPLDYDALLANPGALYVVSTNAESGEAVYFTKNDLSRNNYKIFNASCAIPLACRPQTVGDGQYYDGGVADPVPVQKALDLGCDRLVLILTHPLTYNAESKADEVGARLLEKTGPAVAEELRLKGMKYRQSVALAMALQAEGRCLIVAPDDTCGVKTVTRDRKKLDRLYFKGYHDGRKIAAFLAEA